DEIDPDLACALRVAQELGIRHAELNTLWGKNVIDLSPAEVASAQQLLADTGMEVVAVDPPAFKTCVLDHLAPGSVTADAEFRRHLEMVRRAAERAHQLGARLVRVFSFRR